ncbi:coiled-coil domain-containing protein [Methylobacterium isbiliense]|nr:coiled-coil domain-containing protein [Methylobacterium isbiliense]
MRRNGRRRAGCSLIRQPSAGGTRLHTADARLATPPASREGVTIGRMQVRYLARSDATDDALGIYAMTLAPRSPGAGLHRHAVLTEAFAVAGSDDSLRPGAARGLLGPERGGLARGRGGRAGFPLRHPGPGPVRLLSSARRRPGAQGPRMSAVAFDTLKLARTLRDKAKLSPEQAEGFAEAISDAVQADLATKADLKATEVALRADMKASETHLGSEIARVESELRAEIKGVETRLRAEMEGIENELRTEIKGVETTLRAEIKSVANDLKATEASLKAEIKAQVAEGKSDVIKWVVGAVGCQTVVILGAIVALARLLKP